jgi:hypothetical protein
MGSEKKKRFSVRVYVCRHRDQLHQTIASSDQSGRGRLHHGLVAVASSLPTQVRTANAVSPKLVQTESGMTRRSVGESGARLTAILKRPLTRHQLATTQRLVDTVTPTDGGEKYASSRYEKRRGGRVIAVNAEGSVGVLPEVATSFSPAEVRRWFSSG